MVYCGFQERLNWATEMRFRTLLLMVLAPILLVLLVCVVIAAILASHPVGYDDDSFRIFLFLILVVVFGAVYMKH